MSNRLWYVVHTYSGHEDRVRTNLEKAVNNLGLTEKISQILVPTEEVVEIKRNKKHVKKRKFFPGYVFIEMEIDNETYWLVRNTAGVTGFLGGVKPVPMPEDEVKNLLETMSSPTGAKPRPAITFEKEENVRIIEGPFKHFVGIVEEVNEERGKLKVMVTIFGRPTPVELDFLQVEKL
ncbi:MAG TPA: transcription termination/antitermination protein NusG [Elusimicrobia bacterium]|nr:MAG: transcription termination/antitermination factor NusG [Elusimicrobia bacterium RIFOXYA12_FULL_49_49]OGS09820.1 MAG: transcription termination/antitermination factor NusG [Elusimicrobia bacterium RIFOXYB1_FULL_48_9]OGS09921.1 MAG: transcription termination/antitermination factor NusG [Elusimicrobia bacterium RIFOXYA1_FULL_47_7]OGS16345.1 MAG: transcription termination/antitermination factor NusG [Elusimicrobia bacterium RIFOXYA2_FULL_47_53]OGS27274.1 MAG: transcription termination/antite